MSGSDVIDKLIGTRKRNDLWDISRSTGDRWERAGKIPGPVISEGNLKRYSLNENIACLNKKKKERTERLASQSQQQAVA